MRSSPALNPGEDLLAGRQGLKSANGTCGLVSEVVFAPRRVDSESDVGQTPIHVAAMAGRAEAISLLVGYGVRVPPPPPLNLPQTHTSEASNSGHYPSRAAHTLQISTPDD